MWARPLQRGWPRRPPPPWDLRGRPSRCSCPLSEFRSTDTVIPTPSQPQRLMCSITLSTMSKEWELPNPTVVQEGPSTKKRDELLHIEKVAQAVWEETKAFEVDAPEVGPAATAHCCATSTLDPFRWISSCVGVVPRCWHIGATLLAYRRGIWSGVERLQCCGWSLVVETGKGQHSSSPP